MKRYILSMLAIGLVAVAPACGGSDDPAVDGGGDASDANVTDASDGDVVLPCPANPTQVVVTASITSNTTWTCQNTYVLSGYIFVENNAVLTIQPGTTIMGAPGTPSGTLIVTRGARLEAVGTADEPIVFTSTNTPGTREPSDWGGIVLFGAAPSNLGANVHFEGTPAGDTRFDYSGNVNTHDCGTLEYVRVEFAGYEFTTDKEFNGITLAGCGSETRLSYVQTHRGSDDGIEFFGGSANADHIVISRNQDDGLDWDNGFSGRIQNIIIYTESDGDHGIEADNLEAGTGATPVSSPTIFNLTVLGPGTAAGANSDRGILLRRHTRGLLNNVLVGNYTTYADVVGNMTNDPNLAAAWPASIVIANASFFGGGVFPTADDGFVDNTVIPATTGNNTTDPMIVFGSNTNPSFVPTNAALEAGIAPTAGFDTSATYRGAVAPNATGAAIWYAGWTTFVND